MKYNLRENNRMLFTDARQYNLITFSNEASSIALHSLKLDHSY